jgi:hypothetical protein
VEFIQCRSATEVGELINGRIDQNNQQNGSKARSGQGEKLSRIGYYKSKQETTGHNTHSQVNG